MRENEFKESGFGVAEDEGEFFILGIAIEPEGDELVFKDFVLALEEVDNEVRIVMGGSGDEEGEELLI